MPFWFDVQVARNYGVGFLRDAVMGTVNLGAVKKAGDLRFLYQYGIKDGNSIVSQFTDDDFGTETPGLILLLMPSVLILVYPKFLQWQNLVFITDERRRAITPVSYFSFLYKEVPHTSYRFQSQFAFVF